MIYEARLKFPKFATNYKSYKSPKRNILVVIKDYESAFDAVTLIQIP